MSEPRPRPRRDRRPAAGAEGRPRGAEARALAEPAEVAPAPAAPPAEGAPAENAFDGTYRVQLAQFEGPLDLLLHLIQQHELDILDIPVGFVTKKYLEYLSLMQSMSIDIASEYLVMAATLAHIKSRMLLPAPPPGQDDAMPGEEELDPREELVRRLLEYQKYKAAAAELSGRESTLGRDVFVRGMTEDVPDGPAPFAPPGVFSLLDAFEKVLKRANIKIDHEVVFDRISITDRMVQLTERLTERRAMRFEELFEIPITAPEPGAAPAGFTRFDLIITFLALLEMCKLKVARVYQSDPLAPIHIELAVDPGAVPAIGEEDGASPRAPTAPAKTEASAASEETKPALAEESPALAEGSPALAGESAALAEESSSVAEESGPVVEESGPVAEESSSMAEESGLAAQESSPVVQESGLAAQESSPVVQESGPVAEESSPVVQESSLAAQGSSLAAQESSPVVQEGSLAVQESSLAAQESSPAAQESGSVAQESSPVAEGDHISGEGPLASGEPSGDTGAPPESTDAGADVPPVGEIDVE